MVDIHRELTLSALDRTPNFFCNACSPTVDNLLWNYGNRNFSRDLQITFAPLRVSSLPL